MESQLTRILGQIHAIPSLFAEQLAQVRVHVSHAEELPSTLLIFPITCSNVTALPSYLIFSFPRTGDHVIKYLASA